jgi:hypothetical protein
MGWDVVYLPDCAQIGQQGVAVGIGHIDVEYVETKNN